MVLVKVWSCIVLEPARWYLLLYEILPFPVSVHGSIQLIVKRPKILGTQHLPSRLVSVPVTTGAPSAALAGL